MKKDSKKNLSFRKTSSHEIPGKSSPIITKYLGEVSNKLVWISLFLLICITTISYTSSFKNTFTTWDDEYYAINNYRIREISFKQLKDDFIGKGKFYAGNYHPLSMLSMSIDYKLSKSGFLVSTGKNLRKGTEEIKHYDLEPLIFIIGNLILHLMNIIILFWCIYLLTRKFMVSLIVASLFALNPMHVESVIWIAERKDVLYTFFFLISMLLYIKYITVKQLRWYFLSLILFILSLLSKGQAVTLSLVLILLDYYKDRNLLDKKVILEKIPFLFLSLAFGIIAVFAQKKSNAIQPTDFFSFPTRLLFAIENFVMYFVNLTVPINLSAIYPYPSVNDAVPIKFYLSIIPFLIIMLFLFYSIENKKKDLFFGLSFYLINIFPLLQLLPVGGAIMADRYSYIPSIGYSFLIATGIYFILKKKKNLAIPVFLLLLIYFIILSSLTFNQTKIWRNDYTLWSHTVSKSPDSFIALSYLGTVERDLKKFEEALTHLNRAINLNGGFPISFITRGGALRELKRFKEAIQDFTSAIELKPDSMVLAQAYHSRGVSEENLHQYNEALKDYNKTLKLSNIKAEYFSNRGRLFGVIDKLDSAITDMNKAILMDSLNYQYFGTRGAIYYKKYEYERALKDFNKALNLNTQYTNGYLNRGICLFELNQFTSALQDFNELIRLDPKSHDGYLNRALCKRNTGDYKGSYDDYTKLISLYPNSKLAYYQRAMLNIQFNANSLVCEDLLIAKKLGYSTIDNYIQKYCK